MTTLTTTRKTAAWFAPCADLIEDLPAKDQERILAVTHSSYLEGIAPSRARVARLAAVARGDVTTSDAVAQVLARYRTAKAG